jgi:hypothetical protein
MTALTRLLTRFLLAATLLLLAGLLPAATLLLIRARVALLRLVRLWLVRVGLVRVAHALSPQGLTGLPLGVNAWNRRKLRRKTSNARANFARYRCQFSPKFRRELKTGHTRLYARSW